MFAILAETSSSTTSSRILGKFPNSKFHFLKFFNAFVVYFLYFEAKMYSFVTAAVMTCIVTFFLKKATNNSDIIRHNLGYNEAHFLHIKQLLVAHN